MNIGQLIKPAANLPKYTDKNLHSLGGYESVLDKVSDLVRYLQDPAEYCKKGIKPFKGVILSGPPGVGKTLLAEAVSGHAGVPLFNLGPLELPTMHDLFDLAAAHSPSVICINELDSIGAKRIFPLKSDTAHSTVSQLLSLLSQDRPGVVVIGTTNHYDALDPALIHEGRFDRHIPLFLPNREDRKKILEKYIQKINLVSTASLHDLASFSRSYSGAKLAVWVNEAAVCAIRENSSTLDIHHFDAARTFIEKGIVQRCTLDPEQRFAIAAHEAGHAVVGHLLKYRPYKVSLFQIENVKGFTEWFPQEENKIYGIKELLNHICMLLGGRAGEELVNKIMEGSGEDISSATAIAIEMVTKQGMGSTLHGSNEDVVSIMSMESFRASKLLKDNRELWERVRDALFEHEELTYNDFHKVLKGEKIPPKKWAEENRALLLPPQKPFQKKDQ